MLRLDMRTHTLRIFCVAQRTLGVINCVGCFYKLPQLILKRRNEEKPLLFHRPFIQTVAVQEGVANNDDNPSRGNKVVEVLIQCLF